VWHVLLACPIFKDLREQFLGKPGRELEGGNLRTIVNTPKFAKTTTPEMHASNTVILIHYDVGVSRSTTIMIGYLMRKHHMALTNALAMVKSRGSSPVRTFGATESLARYGVRGLRECRNKGAETAVSGILGQAGGEVRERVNRQ